MDAIDRFNAAIDEANVTMLSMLSLTPAAELVVVGGLDLSYYHEFELTFSGVTYVASERDFDPARLRRARAAEVEALEREVDDDGGELFCFESTFDRKVLGRVVAADVTFRRCLVYYYDRSPLGPGESVAPWVKKGGLGPGPRAIRVVTARALPRRRRLPLGPP